MHNQNTAPQGAAQAFEKERDRRKYSWLRVVKRKLRSDHGRDVCKQKNVCPRLVAELVDEISGYPSFKEHGEIWAGQQRLGLSLGVQDRQVRRAVRALVELDLLRVQRKRGRLSTNNMAALLHGCPLFETNSADYGSSPSLRDGTRVSSSDRTGTSSNTYGGEAQKYTSPVGPSDARRRETPMAKEEESNFDQLNSGGGCSQSDTRPSATKANSPKSGDGRAVSFAQVMRVYPHPRGQREYDAYEPAARLAWDALGDAQRAEALKAAPHAPGKSWLKHWLNDARETGIFEILNQPAAGLRVWISEGTPQHAAWTEHCRSRGRHVPTTQHRIDGELRTGWMFESEWPPNFNFVQSDGRAA